MKHCIERRGRDFLKRLFQTGAGCLFIMGIALMPSKSVRAGLPEPDKLPVQADMPDPLLMLGGQKVSSKEEWFAKRRPELENLFQHYMYGHFPAKVPVKAKVERVDKEALGGKATLKEITLTLTKGKKSHSMSLLLIVPNKRKGPAPVFVGLNFRGNHTVLKDPKIALPTSWVPKDPLSKDNKATDKGRGAQVDVWNVEDIIDRGYALATVYCGDIDPDRGDVREGVQPVIDPKGEHDWGSIAAWAWGIMRVIDYLETDADIDAGRIVVVGHSRLGKTALLAGAFDTRIAVVMPHQAGMGGTAPSRGKVGEPIKRINDAFPHWFNANYKKFNTQPERLPFDQNALVALCAPRPVLFTNAKQDQWANPDGQFEVLKAANPVYRLLGTKGLEAKMVPQVGDAPVMSRLGYWIREGKHSMSRADWQVFLDYADRWLSKR